MDNKSGYIKRYVPLVEKIESTLKNKKRIVIAIDGRAASGKTTLADYLRLMFGAGIVHTDDFFLPQSLRSEERLREAGANIHYERFIKEVLPFVRSGEEFSYRRYDCKEMAFNSLACVENAQLLIVEGAYSCHPIFTRYYDIAVFSDVEKNEQMRRIIERNGEKSAQMFLNRWIPLEEEYFKAYDIEKCADIKI